MSFCCHCDVACSQAGLAFVNNIAGSGCPQSAKFGRQGSGSASKVVVSAREPTLQSVTSSTVSWFPQRETTAVETPPLPDPMPGASRACGHFLDLPPEAVILLVVIRSPMYFCKNLLLLSSLSCSSFTASIRLNSRMRESCSAFACLCLVSLERSGK